MEIKFTDRAQLKDYFKKNKIPKEADFVELIDAAINQREDGVAKLPNDPLSIQAIGEPGDLQRLLNFYSRFTDPEPAWSFNMSNKDQDGKVQKGLTITSRGSSRLFIQNDTGRIGIGTTDPAGKLQIINASEDAGGTSLVVGPASGSNLRLGYHDNYSWIQSHGEKPLAINPLGQNVGIGTPTPDARLQIISTSGDANTLPLVIGPIGASNLRLGYHDNYSWIQSHGSKPLAINPLGNDVGIGTTKPLKKLDVDKGEFRVRATHNEITRYDIASFYAENSTQGIGIGYCRIAAIGSNANQDIEFMPKGPDGVLRFHANNGAQGSATFQIEKNINNINTTYAFSPHASYNGALGSPTKLWRNIYCHDLYRNYEYSASDIRLKENLTPIQNALDKLRSLTGYRYDLKEAFMNSDKRLNNLGLVAQEVEQVLPESVRYEADQDMYFINYSSIIPVLVEGIKQLAAQVTELRAGKAICQ